MKIALIIFVAFVAVVATMLIIGTLLPQQHQATRAVTIHRPASDIYAVVRDFESAPSWRHNLRRVEMLDPDEGRTRFREMAKDGSITYEVVEESADERLVTRIVNRDLGYFGSWTYDFSGVPDGTIVRITEKGEVPNILFRFLSHFVFGHTGTMDTYLAALAAKFGDAAKPE